MECAGFGCHGDFQHSGGADWRFVGDVELCPEGRETLDLPVHGEFVIKGPRSSDPTSLPPSPMPRKLLAHEKRDCIAGESAGQTGHSLGNWRGPRPGRGEYPLKTAVPGPAALSPPSARSSPRRPLPLRVLFPVPEPSSAHPHGHNTQARYPATLSSWVQGFQISIPLLLQSEAEARSKRALTGTDPSHL